MTSQAVSGFDFGEIVGHEDFHTGMSFAKADASR